MAEPQTNPLQPIPQALSHLIHLNVEYKVLVCLGSGCGKAVSPAAFSEHLRTKHTTIPNVRKQVREYTQEFPYQYDYKTVPLPPDESAPQPIIPIVAGFYCQHCAFRTQSRKWVKDHGNKVHSMKRVENEMLFRPVQLQTWFRNSRERYWVVDKSRQAERASQMARDIGEESSENKEESGQASHSGDDHTDPIGPIKNEIEKWKEEAKERRLTLLARPPADELDPWLRYTGWNEMLGQSKHNMVKTYEYIYEPDSGEPELVRLLQIWGRILQRCLDTLAATDHKDMLKWWMSPKNEAASQHPFELHQNSASVDKCNIVWQQFIYYAMRIAPILNMIVESGLIPDCGPIGTPVILACHPDSEYYIGADSGL